MSKSTHLTGQLVYAQALKLIRPTFGVRHQLPETFLKSAPASHFSPQRARVARASAVFRFLPSPLHHTTVRSSETVTCG